MSREICMKSKTFFVFLPRRRISFVFSACYTSLSGGLLRDPPCEQRHHHPYLDCRPHPADHRLLRLASVPLGAPAAELGKQETAGSAFLRGFKYPEDEVRSATEAMPEDKYNSAPPPARSRTN
jgi:hypothetical protein